MRPPRCRAHRRTVIASAAAFRVVCAEMSVWSKLRRLFTVEPEPAPSAQRRFMAEIVGLLRAQEGVTSIRERPEDFALVVQAAGGTHTIYLTNLFSEIRDHTPADRAARIRRFLGVVSHPPVLAPDWETARQELVPLLRPSSLLLGGPPGADLLVRRPVAPFLVECIGIDAEDSLRLVISSHLETWEKSADEIFAVARKNAKGAFRDADANIYDKDLPYRLWHVDRDDSYESSRLLLPGWLSSFANRVTGRPVAIVPHRSFVLVGGDGDPACLERLIETAAREYRASPRRISPALYTADAKGAMVPLLLPPEHPLAAQVLRGHVLLASAEYQEQTAALQKKHGDALFVASYECVESESGGVRGYTTWKEHLPSLLPRADELVFVIDPEGTPRSLRVPWRLALAEVGDCLAAEPGLFPPRWRTLRWPGPAMLSALEALTRAS
jgi:hypothetical protein